MLIEMKEFSKFKLYLRKVLHIYTLPEQIEPNITIILQHVLIIVLWQC